VSWWRGEGNADDSAGPNNGVAQNGVTYVPGVIGQAFNFNGTTSDVLIPTSTTLNLADGFTIALWINLPTGVAQSLGLIEKLVPSVEDKVIGINSTGTVYFYLYNLTPVSPTFSSNTALTLNTWHHIAATYDGNDENIYIDGAFDATQVASGDVSNGAGALTFAHNAARAAAGTNTFFAGSLDEIRWYSRALSAQEIAALASGCN
jgi:hypothetical protein